MATKAKKRSPSKGFIVVATNYKAFYELAVFCGESLKDYWPEAHVTLFTEEKFIDDRARETFDNIITEGVPSHYRAKLWALANTPYDVTCYLDADMEIVHEDIKTVFDLLPEGKDVALTKVRPYNARISRFPGGELTMHCGFLVYRKTKHTIKFMERWWEQYLFQRAVDKNNAAVWNFDEKKYPKELRIFDMFAFWWVYNIDKLPLDVVFIEDDARWNFHHGYLSTEAKKPVVIYHHEVPGKFTDGELKYGNARDPN
jgi:hypothetical protein